MVMLDLLDLDPSTKASENGKGYSQGQGCASVGPVCRGEVVLAKYPKANRFYWAKVKKLYKSSTGDDLCDVEWLRPLAGVPAGKLYALHYGHDETLGGDGLSLPNSIRRPCADDLKDGSPSGAKAFNTAATVCSKAINVPDLLDLSNDRGPEPDLLGSESQVRAQLPVQAKISELILPPAQAAPMGNQAHNWQANFDAIPGYSALGTQVHSSMPVGIGGLQPRPSPPFLHSNPKPVAPASLNDMQASFASSNFVLSSGKKYTPSSMSMARKNGEESFDFISDMMSGALTGAK